MPEDRTWRIGAERLSDRPVLYLDVDDTLIVHARAGSHPAPDGRAFLRWAADAFELRWLTYWAPDGRLGEGDLRALARMFDLEPELLERIEGLPFGGTVESTKLDAVAWLEHLVVGRPFLWIEDDDCMISIPRILTVLNDAGFADRWVRCNVTRTPDRLSRIYRALREAPHAFGPGQRILDSHRIP